jgi:Protein of unknown function (DUF1588)/Protein of unknown function (DUF1587)/Protein of unknown function (DUF1585)/Protein of unknown function (DUF1595)/Protein of unknown function (DUF1592)/Planctomycete cytochrome C
MNRFKTACLIVLSTAGLASAASRSFNTVVEPFVRKNCSGCHNPKLKTGGLDLMSRQASDLAGQDRDLWEKVIRRVEAGEMPPKPIPPPKEPDIHAFQTFIQGEFDRADRHMRPDPGRVTAHRLNRYEYNNTIRDLLAVDFKPAKDFPADDSGYGFDNIGDVLSLSPTLMEKYLAAAEQIAKKAIAADPLPKPTIDRLKADLSSAHPEWFEGKRSIGYQGDYEVRIAIAGQSTKNISHLLKLAITIDGQDHGDFEVDTAADKKRGFDVRLPLMTGDHVFRAALTTAEEGYTIPFHVDHIEFRGPFNPVPPPLPESHKRIFVCGHANGQHTPECSRLIVRELARRAFRRPVTDSDVEPYTKFIAMAQDEGDSFEQGVRVALEAILVSPEFLFRVERDADADKPAANHRISDFELATRLSYFLWSSMPDEELFRLAGQNTLHKQSVLEAQVRRMLNDPKSFALVENFGGQLRDSMRRETQLFFQSVIHDDRSILDFLDGKYTYLNERLAKHYGIAGVTGPEFRRVELTGDERSGVLTQASVLTVSSYAARTSPVLRGKFILENFLNAAPPPPPPDVPNLDESKIGVAATVRQQFEAHRANPICASCHMRMDPLGFALENYDAIGRWRTHEGKFPIDSSGVMPDGRKFDGAAGMKSVLVGDRDQFARALTEKILTYGLGRGLERYDNLAVQSISRRLRAKNYRFSALVLGVVESLPFEMRRGDAGEVTVGRVKTTASISKRSVDR